MAAYKPRDFCYVLLTAAAIIESYYMLLSLPLCTHCITFPIICRILLCCCCQNKTFIHLVMVPGKQIEATCTWTNAPSRDRWDYVLFGSPLLIS